MEPDPLDTPASAAQLRWLAGQRYFDHRALDRALSIAGYRPAARQWRAFLSQCLLVLGAVLLISGVFFFFAYNWQDMHRFLKLGLIQLAIGAAVTGAVVRGLDQLSGKVCLLVAALLLGALLAVFGQVYQTGADAYQLFLAWAALIAAWVAVSRFTPLWAVLLALLNVLLATYYQQTQANVDLTLPMLMFLLNAGWLVIWELASQAGQPWMHGRWFPRTVALIASGCILLPTLEFVTEFPYWFSTAGTVAIAPVLFAIFVVSLWLCYSRLYRDLMMLTVVALNLIVVTTALVIQVFSGTEGLIVVGMALIGQTAIAVVLLRQVARRWEVTA